MQYRLKSRKDMLDGFVLNLAHGYGQTAFQASQLKTLREDFKQQALRLRHLFIWFPEDRKAIVAAARAGVATMRTAYAKHRLASLATGN